MTHARSASKGTRRAGTATRSERVVKGALELRHLRAFIAVAETEHVTRAAARLRVAQPALSRQMQQLEAAVGVPLLARTGRGVRLTAAGRAFLDDARRLTRGAADAVTRAQDVARGAGGVLRVGFIEVASASGLVPEAVRRFAASHTSIRVDLQELPSAGQVAALRARELDVGFVCGRAVGRVDGLAAATVLADPLVAVFAEGHRLGALRRVPLARLAGERLLLVRRSLGAELHDDVLAALAGVGVEAERVQEVSQLQTIVHLAAAGLGVGIVPRAVVAGGRGGAGALARPVLGLPARHRTDLVWNAQAADELAAAFVAVCRAVARDVAARGAAG